MMFAKDTSDNADLLQYIKVLTPSATLADDQQEAVNPERRAKQPAPPLTLWEALTIISI